MEPAAIALQAAMLALLALLVAEMRSIRRQLDALKALEALSEKLDRLEELVPRLPVSRQASLQAPPGTIAAGANASIPASVGAAKAPAPGARATAAGEAGAPEEISEAGAEEKKPPPAYRPLRPISLEMGFGGDWQRREGPSPLRSPEEIAEMVRRAKEKWMRREKAEGEDGEARPQ